MTYSFSPQKAALQHNQSGLNCFALYTDLLFLLLLLQNHSRPRAVKQQQFEYGYLFGAICLMTGQTEVFISPLVNKDIMSQHLKLISQATFHDRHAVVIVDGAGWHTQDMVSCFDNVTLIKLPPYSPELNPMEQVW